MQRSIRLPLWLVALLAIPGVFAFRFALTEITRQDAAHAARLFDLEFSDPQLDSVLSLLDEQRSEYRQLRKNNFPNHALPPALVFDPRPAGWQMPAQKPVFQTDDYSATRLPAKRDDLAYYNIGQLAELLRTRQITSLELTEFFLARLKKHDPQLHCVITYTEDLARAQAKQADVEIAGGKYRGLLHGIPYGLKDMFFYQNYPATFGTPPFKEQQVEEDATVVQKLYGAGAVLIAKLSLGELAMDDVWFGGQTRCPWDTQRGSSGSSAGPASAVSAGLVPFAIGSETWGSIVSPCTVNGVTGLRPTFGRVSRSGAMALSWSMDKVGPICRNAEDCAIVLRAIAGADPKDAASTDAPLAYRSRSDLKGVRIGYLQQEMEQDSVHRALYAETIKQLEQLGATLVPVVLPGYKGMTTIISAESAAAFDELTRSHGDDRMVQQGKYNWPNFFRAGRFIPAVEYIQANRLRYDMIQKMAEVMKTVDVVIGPPFGDNLLTTNLTGHPSLTVPAGFDHPSKPATVVFTGQLYGEGMLLSIAKVFQNNTGHHKKHPPGY
ncbi:MAG: amidase [Lewinellaceae bacterium]|nr:amidase [Lewinellaceae bacterium]